jgi:hypothetical protein
VFPGKTSYPVSSVGKKYIARSLFFLPFFYPSHLALVSFPSAIKLLKECNMIFLQEESLLLTYSATYPLSFKQVLCNPGCMLHLHTLSGALLVLWAQVIQIRLVLLAFGTDLGHGFHGNNKL